MSGVPFSRGRRSVSVGMSVANMSIRSAHGRHQPLRQLVRVVVQAAAAVVERALRRCQLGMFLSRPSSGRHRADC